MRRILILLLVPFFIFANISIDELIKKAKEGDSNAIYQLGYCFENGINVKQDLKRAKELYKKAASLGNEDAKITLGLLNLDNSLKNATHHNNSIKIEMKNSFSLNLTNKDLKELLQKAKNGDKDAIFTIGVLYENGYGAIAQDRAKALTFYKKAASLGSKKAKEIILLREK